MPLDWSRPIECQRLGKADSVESKGDGWHRVTYGDQVVYYPADGMGLLRTEYWARNVAEERLGNPEVQPVMIGYAVVSGDRIFFWDCKGVAEEFARGRTVIDLSKVIVPPEAIVPKPEKLTWKIWLEFGRQSNSESVWVSDKKPKPGPSTIAVVERDITFMVGEGLEP